MTIRTLTDVLLRLATAATLAVSGYIHAQLYVTGYRFLHVVGVLFLLQASASFALAALLTLGGPVVLRVAAAGAASPRPAPSACSASPSTAGSRHRRR